MSKVSTKKKSRTRILDSFWGALAILVLSTLPYFHDIITDADGLKSWVPILGIENLLTDSNGKIFGFSTYRVFLYTLLLFVFASIGWLGWYQSAKRKFYGSPLLLVTISGIYQIVLILLNLKRTFWNDPTLKVSLLIAAFLTLGFFYIKKKDFNINKLITYGLLLIIAVLPFYHDVLTDRDGLLRSWMPNFGLETILTNNEGFVYGFLSYRALVYFFCIHLFAHLGWIGWFMDAKGKRFRPFLLMPIAQSLYQLIVIIMSWWESRLNDVDIKLYITLVLCIFLAINFFYNNKVSPKIDIAIKKTPTIKSNESEN